MVGRIRCAFGLGVFLLLASGLVEAKEPEAVRPRLDRYGIPTGSFQVRVRTRRIVDSTEELEDSFQTGELVLQPTVARNPTSIGAELFITKPELTDAQKKQKEEEKKKKKEEQGDDYQEEEEVVLPDAKVTLNLRSVLKAMEVLYPANKRLLVNLVGGEFALAYADGMFVDLSTPAVSVNLAVRYHELDNHEGIVPQHAQLRFKEVALDKVDDLILSISPGFPASTLAVGKQIYYLELFGKKFPVVVVHSRATLPGERGVPEQREGSMRGYIVGEEAVYLADHRVLAGEATTTTTVWKMPVDVLRILTTQQPSQVSADDAPKMLYPFVEEYQVAVAGKSPDERLADLREQLLPLSAPHCFLALLAPQP